jgi:hypothetical protein
MSESTLDAQTAAAEAYESLFVPAHLVTATIRSKRSALVRD